MATSVFGCEIKSLEQLNELLATHDVVHGFVERVETSFDNSPYSCINHVTLRVSLRPKPQPLTREQLAVKIADDMLDVRIPINVKRTETLRSEYRKRFLTTNPPSPKPSGDGAPAVPATEGGAVICPRCGVHFDKRGGQ